MPFVKVKGLSTDLTIKLQEQASTEAFQQACCDEETAKTNEKKVDLDSHIEHLIFQDRSGHSSVDIARWRSLGAPG